MPLGTLRRRRHARRRRAVLVTGFEPFGDHDVNPSGEVARRLDGKRIEGHRVVGRVLPVALDVLAENIAASLDEVDPIAVIGLGLAGGEAVIRLERVALNIADFAKPDNAGRRVKDLPLDARDGPALAARLPLRAIQRALLDNGIPARLSNSAGTYLCNATMYGFLAATPRRVPCGFIHLPYLRPQIAAMLADHDGQTGDSESRELASMELVVMRRAIEIALAATLRAGVVKRHRGRPPRA
ncbi:MAG: hypothetical protein HY246_16045 [Proteobacteria bacterium]|nr:hypothetical protein [Pseudomonadota bacterium]